MPDELHDKTRKIGTDGGDYQESGQSQRVEVNLSSHDTQSGKAAQENRAIMDALLLMQGKRLDAKAIADLQSRFSEHGDAIARAVRIMTVQTMNDLQDSVDRLSACVARLTEDNARRDAESELQERKQDRRINALTFIVISIFLVVLLQAIALWQAGVRIW